MVHFPPQLQPVMYLGVGHYLLGKTDIPTEIQNSSLYVSHRLDLEVQSRILNMDPL